MKKKSEKYTNSFELSEIINVLIRLSTTELVNVRDVEIIEDERKYVHKVRKYLTSETNQFDCYFSAWKVYGINEFLFFNLTKIRRQRCKKIFYFVGISANIR